VLCTWHFVFELDSPCQANTKNQVESTKSKIANQKSKMLSGLSIIGFHRGADNGQSFRAVNPATSQELQPDYQAASEAEVFEAVILASKAFESYRLTAPATRATFLRKIAENIEGLGDELCDRAIEETGLPAARIRSETARTCFQLRLFADLVAEASWVDARIDRADNNRQPLRKPDVRSMFLPLGPVVVFCASNFPLAFSVAGGDTASALASGNPVVVKAHRAHPGTAELVGQAVSEAVRECDLPEGVFSLLFGRGEEIGMQLVRDPLIKAGGFTGSRAGGQALMNAAAARPEPIPFYAEMSSVNPIFIFPGALAEREDDIVTGLQASVTLGAGQFCTNPGLVFVPAGSSLIDKLREKMRTASDFVMLTSRICAAYQEGAAALSLHAAVKSLLPHTPATGNANVAAQLFTTDGASFLADGALSAEVFGPSTLLVTYSSVAELPEIAKSLEGQLTATVHATEAESESVGELVKVIENKVGRIVFNGFPTGVEVGHAMVHGGPFPATSDGRSTSVGTRAIFRFVRAVCYQDAPQKALPDELKDGNPLGIWRLVDGELSKAST
jgi:NADP-dependent aldehyde dehydrogenase